jgi:GAF domain-containing protein
MLARVGQLVAASLPGAHEVSVTLVQGDSARTAAYTGAVALQLDQVQYDEGRGPCLDAATNGHTIVVADVAAESRWPSFTAHAVEAGVGASLSIGLPVQQDTVGALNIYGKEPNAFNDGAVEAAEQFASYAAVAVANVVSHERASTLAGQMQQAMQSRAVIEQAKGILMAQRQCDADEAFGILVRLSQQTNTKLRDVATTLVRMTISPDGSSG